MRFILQKVNIIDAPVLFLYHNGAFYHRIEIIRIVIRVKRLSLERHSAESAANARRGRKKYVNFQ